jgi:hypothetical protein
MENIIAAGAGRKTGGAPNYIADTDFLASNSGGAPCRS